MNALAAARARRRIRGIVRRYLGEVRDLPFAELRRRQRPPYSAIAFGAAGIACAHFRAALATGERAEAAAAARWSRDAARFAGHPEALASGGDPEIYFQPASLPYGHPGLTLVAALADAALGRSPARSIARFAVEVQPFMEPGLIEGTAGHLLGALLLHRHTSDPRLPALADQLAGRLLSSTLWHRLPTPGIAHGRAGVLLALAEWARVRSRALPEPVFAVLGRLARAPFAGVPSNMQRSWCNGAAGLALLWSSFYRLTGERSHLERARRMARACDRENQRAVGDLCCGLGGWSYAQLAVARVDPDGPWRTRALALADRAIDQLRSVWPNGLYKGYPGLVCLAFDLLGPGDPLGFPLCEA